VTTCAKNGGRSEVTVKAVKAQLKSGDPKYKTLMNEYVDAYAKYDGWVGALTGC